MDFFEATEAFTAMDAYGHPMTIPKCAFLHSVGDGSGFMGRIEAGDLASFIYFGSLFYVRKDAIQANTKPMEVATMWRQRNARKHGSETSAKSHAR
jgi:hypothetical protein